MIMVPLSFIYRIRVQEEIIVENLTASVDPVTPVLEEDNDMSYKFIIMTKSAPKSAENRELLRNKSWLSYEWKDEQNNDISWRHFFLLGLTLDPDWPFSRMEEENAKYGDIMVAPALDGYDRMTYKLLAGMKLAILEYKFSFLIVLSEDTIVNVKELDRYLTKLIADKKDAMFYGGALCYRRSVDRTGKWSVSKEDWSPDVYPDFCFGTGMVFSFDTVQELIRIWLENKEPVVGLDDAHIGVLVFLSLGKIKITEIGNVTYGCQKNRSDPFIVTQIQPLEKGVELMQNYMNHGIYCFEDVWPHS